MPGLWEYGILFPRCYSMRNINTLREMFPTSILIASSHGLSVLWPNGFGGNESTERNVGEYRYPVFQELVRSSHGISFDCIAGKHAKITFEIHGFSDKELVFLPVDREITLEELQDLLADRGVCDDWVEVFGDVDINNDNAVAMAFREFFERVDEWENRPVDLYALSHWEEMLSAARVFQSNAAYFDLESYPPKANGGGGCVAFDSTQAELTGFSHTVSGDALAGFRSVADLARDVDVLLCCCNEFTGVGFSFTA